MDDLNLKEVLIFGMGISGPNIVNLFEERGISFKIVDDQKSGYYKKHKIYSTVEILQMNLYIDVIIKSPGIKYNHPLLTFYENVKIINDIEIAYYIAKERNIKIIAITGTNGKTSTTTFLTRLLNFNNYKAYSCGNIGVSALEVLDKEKIIDYLVMELSSFQLKAIDKFQSDYAFFLNFTPDHLDYHINMEDYFASKLNIVKNGTKSNYFFISQEIEYKTEKLTLLKNDINIKMENDVNFCGVSYNNVLLVYQFCKVIGINPYTILDLFNNNYLPLEHRLEYIGEINGIKYINDSKATNVESTKSALSQLNNIILIVGGFDKHEDMHQLEGYLENVKYVIAYGANKNDFTFIPKLYQAECLEDATSIAKTLAKKGDTILLSPASASYDQYKNFEERGEHFKKIVKGC